MSRRYIWIWDAPDAVIPFGTLKRAMAYVEKIHPGGTWERGKVCYWYWYDIELSEDNPEGKEMLQLDHVEIL